MPADAYSTPNELVIEASVSGFKPGDVEITMEREMLTIKSQRRAPLENVDYQIQERRYSLFARMLTLNLLVEAEGTEAVFDKGV